MMTTQELNLKSLHQQCCGHTSYNQASIPQPQRADQCLWAFKGQHYKGAHTLEEEDCRQRLQRHLPKKRPRLKIHRDCDQSTDVKGQHVKQSLLYGCPAW